MIQPHGARGEKDNAVIWGASSPHLLCESSLEMMTSDLLYPEIWIYDFRDIQYPLCKLSHLLCDFWFYIFHTSIFAWRSNIRFLEPVLFSVLSLRKWCCPRFPNSVDIVDFISHILLFASYIFEQIILHPFRFLLFYIIDNLKLLINYNWAMAIHYYLAKKILTIEDQI